MAKENKKVEEPKVEETKKENKSNVTKVNVKSKKPKETITKVNIDNTPKSESTKEEDIIVVNEEPKVEEKVGDTPVVQEITEEDVANVEQGVVNAIEESESTGKPLPEKVQKLVDFMNETGGDLNDYVNLNRDVSKLDDSEVLDEYYRSTKSHLTPEERNFLLEDTFGYDKDIDDPKDIKKKQIALKEQVAEARAHLDGEKSKYYEEIKAGSKLTEEQQKAISFFNRYNKENEKQKKITDASKSTFVKRTDNVFNDEFKGFDYKVGDKKFRFNVKNVNEVKTTQSDLNNFINKFVGEDKVTIEDAAGNHKSLFTAMNADAVAKHFYEQGRADAIKGQVAKDKNIDMNPRQTHGEIEAGGLKVRVLGESSTDMKNRSFKIRKKS